MTWENGGKSREVLFQFYIMRKVICKKVAARGGLYIFWTLPEADPEGGEESSSAGQIFRIKYVKFLDSFLQVFCLLQSTG